MRDKKIDVYKMGGVEVESHLAFADDIVLFCRANAKSFHKIQGILREFKEFSRMEINEGKSLIIFSKSVANCDELCVILGFPSSMISINHLGVPIMD